MRGRKATKEAVKIEMPNSRTELGEWGLVDVSGRKGDGHEERLTK
jgi:hypothetical protein